MSENNTEIQNNNNYFEGIVGLESCRRKLTFYIENYKKSSIFPNICLSSSRGSGKTLLARLISKGLGRKHIEVNSSSIKGLDDLFEIYNLYLSNGNCSLFLDECEALPESVSLALLTILNPNTENRTKYTYNGVEYDFSFKKLNFIFATTETCGIHHALLDRLNLIALDEYESRHLKEILFNNLKEYKIEDGLLDKVVRVVRNNPRNAVRLSNDLLSFLNRKNEKTFTHNDWAQFFKELGLFDLGLTSSEVKLLKILKQFPNSSLTKVAVNMNLTVEATRRFLEQYPMKLGLFTVKPALGRALTPAGHEYLNSISE